MDIINRIDSYLIKTKNASGIAKFNELKNALLELESVKTDLEKDNGLSDVEKNAYLKIIQEHKIDINEQIYEYFGMYLKSEADVPQFGQ